MYGGVKWDEEKYARVLMQKEKDREGRKLLSLTGERGWAICNKSMEEDESGKFKFVGKENQ